MSKIYYRGDIYSNYIIPKMKAASSYIKTACEIKIDFDSENFGWPEIREKLENYNSSVNQYIEKTEKWNQNMESCITNSIELIRDIKIEKIRLK